MLRRLAVLPFLVWSGAVQALSCLPHDVAATYHAAAESPDRFMIVLGEMRFDEALLPVTDFANQARTPPDTLIPARLTGQALSRAGFVHPYDQDVALNAQCFGPWCAGAVSGMTYLAFVNLDRETPEVTITPCGGFAFAKPTDEMKSQILTCRNGGTCVPRRRR